MSWPDLIKYLSSEGTVAPLFQCKPCKCHVDKKDNRGKESAGEKEQPLEKGWGC